MQDGLFFRIVRRINMLLIFVTALALLASIGFLGFQKYQQGELANILPGAEKDSAAIADLKPHYEVALAPYESPVNQNRPTTANIYVLNRTTTFAAVEPYLLPAEVANIMAMDDTSNTGHWLFKGVDRTITVRDGVRKGEFEEGALTDNRPIIGLVLWVVEKDTNKDGAKSYGDAVTVYAWRVGEEAVTKLFDADRGVSTGQLSAKTYGIVYEKGGKRISATYSIPDFKLMSEKVLPDPTK